MVAYTVPPFSARVRTSVPGGRSLAGSRREVTRWETRANRSRGGFDAGLHDFSALAFTIHGSRFLYGDFINAVLAFVSIAAAVFFFVVKPVNALMVRVKTEPPAGETVRPCPECLSEIARGARRCAFCSAQVAPA